MSTLTEWLFLGAGLMFAIGITAAMLRVAILGDIAARKTTNELLQRSLESPQRRQLPIDKTFWLVPVAGAVVLGAWLLWYFLGADILAYNSAILAEGSAGGMAARGQFGDMFGVLNVLFSAAAFAALFWGATMQRHQNAVLQFETLERWRAEDSERDRTVQGHLETIALDVQLAARLATVYLGAGIGVPGYRHPLFGMATALPHLVAKGTLRGSEAVVFAQFYVDADSWNRALNAAHELMDGNAPLQVRELTRARLKASHLIPGSKPSRYDETMAVLRKHLPAEALERLEFDSPGFVSDEAQQEAHLGIGFHAVGSEAVE
jgi:hypothetical protein